MKDTRSQPHVLIIGAGFGGLYAAKALAGASVRITVIDRRNHHLFQPLLYQVATAALSPGDIAYPIRAILNRQRNVRVLLAEATVVDLTSRKVILSDGEILYDYLILATISGQDVRVGEKEVEAGTTLWAAGVEASPLSRTLGVKLDRAGRVLVEPDLAIPGHPEAFVIGDLAVLADKHGKNLPGVCPVAIQQGRHVARNIRGARRHSPLEPFEYIDRGSLATIGRAAAVADFGWIRFSGFFSWAAWLFIHIFFLIGFRNRFVVMLEWAWAYFTFQRAARLITGDINARPSP